MTVKLISSYVVPNQDAGHIIQEMLNDGVAVVIDVPVKSSLGLNIPKDGLLNCKYPLTNTNTDNNHKLVQLSEGATVTGALVGTGKIGVSVDLSEKHVESLVYVPEGAHDAYIDVRLSNATYCFNAQGGDKDHNEKIKRMNAIIRATDAVGVIEGQEGHGAFFSGIEDSRITVIAKRCNRHGIYLGSANQRNNITTYVEDTRHTGVTITSSAGQSPTSNNRVYAVVVDAKPPSKNVTTYSASVDMTSNCHNNKVTAQCISKGKTVSALRVSGVDTTEGPHPSRNLFEITAEGDFVGIAICNFSSSRENTLKTYGAARALKPNSAWVRADNSDANKYRAAFNVRVKDYSIDGVDGKKFAFASGSARVPMVVGRGAAINFLQKKKEFGSASIIDDV